MFYPISYLTLTTQNLVVLIFFIFGVIVFAGYSELIIKLGRTIWVHHLCTLNIKKTP